MRSGRAIFGTVDTWILHKLKNVNGAEKFEAISDITNASATGLYDPFNLEYIPAILKYFKIKKSMLPAVVDNSYDFGYTHKSMLGAPIKIATVIADQVGALIGNACFRKMDMKVAKACQSKFRLSRWIIIYRLRWAPAHFSISTPEISP